MAASLRKKPTQDRSKQRVERILEAATHVFAETGFEAATTETIAERAGVSIGSLYQFFPNKRALFEAVWTRYIDEIRHLFDTFMNEERLERPWQEVLDETIDAFWFYQQTSRSFQAVYRSYLSLPELIPAGDEVNREIARRLEGVLARKAKIPEKHRSTVATVIVETMSAMLLVAARMSDARAKLLIGETKILLNRYLTPYAKR